MSAVAEKGPDTPSADYAAMAPYWNMVETIVSGSEAMRDAGELYLPSFPNEDPADYEYRRKNAKFTNVYADVVDNLAKKPFSEEVTLKEGASDTYKSLAEDIDGSGNNLHVFSEGAFADGIHYAVDWVLVDFTKATPNANGRPLTRQDEAAQGLRPYWVRIPAKQMLAIYSAKVNGKETFVHARFREDAVQRDGYAETTSQRVRVLNRAPLVIDGKVVGYGPATYALFEKRKDEDGKEHWDEIEAGAITIGVIPLVPFVTGKRLGSSWRFIPPLRGAAYLQIEHYQQETALKSIKELTAYPMLAANGVSPAMADGKPAAVPVGPKTVLYAPPAGDHGQHGEWMFIEPTAESLKFLADDVKATEAQIRELGRQPLTATAGITVVTAALASQKASSAVQAWAWRLKDALEQAFKFTALWLKDDSPPEVVVHTDFAIDLQDEQGQQTLLAARKNGDLSRETLWEELRRRSILSGDFDADEEVIRLEQEAPDPLDAADLQGALTPPVAA